MNKYELALVVSAKIEDDEMGYIEGGLQPNQLNVSTAYLNRDTCMSVAAKFVNKPGVEPGLSQSRIAHEIYAHTLLYYASPAILAQLPAAVVTMGVIGAAVVAAEFAYIRGHSNPIDIGNDSAVRVKIYDILWGM